MTLKNKILIATTLVCSIEIAIRCFWSHQLSYLFLMWNLLLAWIPYLLSNYIQTLSIEYTRRTKTLGLFFTWFVFFPNAPYIITDFIHLGSKPPVPLWFDLILLTSFAWNGMLLGYFSLRTIHQLLNQLFKPQVAWLLVIGILFFAGYGIYLGRIERWNSWDVVTNPMNLLIHVIKTVVDFNLFLKAFGITLFFGVFMIGIYLSIYFFQTKKQDE